MKSFAFITLLVAIVSLSLAASATDTDINFNFEGMIPAGSGSGSAPKAHHFDVFEISTTDVATPGYDDETSAPLMTDVWANQLWNLAKTEVMGYAIGQCTITPAINNVGLKHELCHITHFFNNAADQIVIMGAATRESMPQTMSVVGGTGMYSGAYGSCTYQPYDNFDVHYNCDFFTPN